MKLKQFLLSTIVIYEFEKCFFYNRSLLVSPFAQGRCYLFVGGEGREREGGVGYGIINSLLMLQARPPLLFHNVQKDVTKQYYFLLFLHSDWFILIVNWRRDV